MKSFWKGLMLLLMCTTSVLTLTAQETKPDEVISLRPQVVDGMDINGFPSGGTFFVYTRPQQEEITYKLTNCVPSVMYNDLVDSYNEQGQVLREEVLAHEHTQHVLETVLWTGGGVVVTTVVVVLLGGYLSELNNTPTS